jgi:hypothetical protein
MRVLVYVDSPAMVSSGSAIGRALRNELDADVLMLVVDSARHRDALPKDFTIHDFAELFWPYRGPTRKERTVMQRLRRLLLIILASPLLVGAMLRGRDPWETLADAHRRFARVRARALRQLGLRPRVVRLGGRHTRKTGPVLNAARWVIGNIRRAVSEFRRHVTAPIRRFLKRFRMVWRIRAVLLTPIELKVPARIRALLFPPVARRSARWLLSKFRGVIAGFDRHLKTPVRRYLLSLRVVREFRALQSLRFYRRGIRNFLRRVKPDVIIVFEDNIETLTRIFIAVGEEMGSPSTVVPYTIPNPLEPVMNLVTNLEHRSGPWIEKAISRFSQSQWVFEFEGKRVLRLPPFRILLMEMLGLSVPNPWVLNSGSARAIALDSEMSRRAYIDLGFPSQQLEVVGEPVGEQLFAGLSDRDALRKRLAEENAFDPVDRPLLVCAFPPDQYRGTETGAYELPDFPALVDTWMRPLLEVSRHANVLVRPHPRLNTRLLEAYETDRLKITWRPTAELVPAADLYVASISATIRWAIACGVPVLNYDCYRYRYGDYKAASGVLTLFSGDEFRAAALRFFSDPTFAEELRKQQDAVRGDWGMIDAGFPERFGRLVSRIIRKERGAP